MMMNRLTGACGLFLFLLVPPVKNLMESVMVVHMLIQIPLLIVVGALIGDFLMLRFASFFKKWNGTGIPGIMLVFLVTMYWMVPRAMDEALALQGVEIFKFAGLPLLVGIPLRASWPLLQTIGKGFVIFNYIPMFGMMAWLYIDSPIQICNNYLESEQKMLGWSFLFIMLLMLFYVLQAVFTDQRPKTGN